MNDTSVFFFNVKILCSDNTNRVNKFESKIVKVVKHLLNSFKNMHLTSEEYDSVVPEIRNNNFQSINIVCSASLAIFTIMLIANFFLPGVSQFRRTFLIAIFVSIVLLLINNLFVRENKKFTLPMAYLIITCLYAYGLYVGVFLNSQQEAATFCVIIFVVPLLFIDRSWRIDVFTVLGCLTYIIHAKLFKSSPIVNIDVMNVISFALLGIFFNRYFNHLKLRDFLILHVIEVDKDYDNLLGILNRRAVVREIKKNLLITNSSGILLFVNLHNLAKINDKYGAASGDDVLQQVSDQLKKIFRTTDLIGRYEGDRFLIFMPNLVNLDIAKVRAKMILVALAENIKVPEESITLTASIGMAACEDYGETYKSLFKKSQTALISAQSKPDNSIVVYSA